MPTFMMKRKKDVFEEILKDFEKKMEHIIETLDEPTKVKKQAFSVRIQPGEHGPEVFVQRYDGKKSETQHLRLEPAQKKRKIKQFTEPVAKMVRKGGHIVIEAALPGVKRGDIELNQLRRSIELRAYAGSKGFFVIFPVPKGYQIIKDEFEDSKYKIHVQVE